MEPAQLAMFFNSGAIVSSDKDSFFIGYGTIKKAASWQYLNSQQPIFYFPDFFLQDPTPWFQFTNWQQIKRQALIISLKDSLSTFDFLNWIKPDQVFFEKNFYQLKQTIIENKLIKAVPYAFSHTIQKMNQERLKYSFKQALMHLETYSGYLYGYWDQQQGILGVTPEILFRYSQLKNVHSMALAGTCKKELSSLSFKNNPKERHEHQIVVDFIQDALMQFGTVKMGETEILSLSHLNHLMTTIEVELNTSADFESLIRALHPTPALGVSPKKNLEWIKNYYTPLERGRFGAPVGFIYPAQEKAQCLVAIRNVQWNEQGLRIGAGCGVVQESVCEKEWDEINLKIQTIRYLLAL